MKTTEQKIAVMQSWVDARRAGFPDGTPLEMYSREEPSWQEFPVNGEPQWDWNQNDYRIKSVNLWPGWTWRVNYVYKGDYVYEFIAPPDMVDIINRRNKEGHWLRLIEPREYIRGSDSNSPRPTSVRFEIAWVSVEPFHSGCKGRKAFVGTWFELASELNKVLSNQNKLLEVIQH